MSFPWITLFSPVIKMFPFFGLKYVKYQWNEKSELESHIWLANLLDQCCFNLKILLIVRFWFRRSRAGWESAFLTHSLLILLGGCEHPLFSSAVLNDWWLVGRHHAMLLWIASRARTFQYHIHTKRKQQCLYLTEALLHWGFSLFNHGYHIFLTSVKSYFFLKTFLLVFSRVWFEM